MKKIMIVEDEKTLCSELVTLLKNNNYEPIVLSNFNNTASEILASNSDLVLLDINIPYVNGEIVLQELRKTSNIPVIMVTSRNSDIDEALSISYGADDYITKPFNSNILLLRIGAVLKRSNNETNTLTYKDVSINIGKGLLKKGDIEITLTKNEMIIFSYLLNHQDRLVTRDELMTDLWNNDEFINDNALTVNISRLRAKLKTIGYEDAIDTRKGMGYILS
ncbi:MAG: response regulator transcription factor [Bacilli bacterium]|mgnify:CR=1 FL=1|nr:response regulator transcription factor [Bacilli bacterium]